MSQKKVSSQKKTDSSEMDVESMIDQSIRTLLKDYGGKELFVEGTQGFLKGEILNASTLGNLKIEFAALKDLERGVIKVSLETISRIRHGDRILWDYTEERERFQKIEAHLQSQQQAKKKNLSMTQNVTQEIPPKVKSQKPEKQKKAKEKPLAESLPQTTPEVIPQEQANPLTEQSPPVIPQPQKEQIKEGLMPQKFENEDRKDPKKINKTFSLDPDAVQFLDSVNRKSAFMNEIIAGYQHGRFIREETAQLLKKHQTLFGTHPEDVLCKILLKRIKKIESNMESLKDSAPADVKNRVGGAFLKLNRVYDALVAENEERGNKQAVTFGLMFKKTGCNHQSIRGWLRANKDRLDVYHQSLGISDPGNHNRQMGVIKRVARLNEEKRQEASI